MKIANLLIDKHVNKIVSYIFVCFNNIRNLGRIGSKLSIPLQTQLVHSMILSHTVTYITVMQFFTIYIPAFLVQKLTKVLYVSITVLLVPQLPSFMVNTLLL